MEDYIIKNTKSTPEFKYNAECNTMSLVGISRAENVIEFYDEIITFINRNQKELNLSNIINFSINLGYFNSSSSKQIIRTIKTLKEIVEKIIINWYYDQEDEELLESGKEFEEILQIEFNYIAKR